MVSTLRSLLGEPLSHLHVAEPALYKSGWSTQGRSPSSPKVLSKSEFRVADPQGGEGGELKERRSQSQGRLPQIGPSGRGDACVFPPKGG